MQRITILILGGFGIIPLFLGTVLKKNHLQKYIFSYLLGILLYFIVIAQGNIQHEYYQVLIIPFISIIVGCGYYYLLNFTYSSKVLSIFMAIFIFSISTFFSWTRVRSNYNIGNNSIIEAGLMAKKLLPPNSLVIAPYNGDTALLYQTGFSGWPIEVYDFVTIFNTHPNRDIYLVSVNFDDYTSQQIAKYKTVFRNNEYIILKLTQ